MRIESCNFKEWRTKFVEIDTEYTCKLTTYGCHDLDVKLCSGEENCVIFLTYKYLEMIQNEPKT